MPSSTAFYEKRRQEGEVWADSECSIVSDRDRQYRAATLRRGADILRNGQYAGAVDDVLRSVFIRSLEI